LLVCYSWPQKCVPNPSKIVKNGTQTIQNRPSGRHFRQQSGPKSPSFLNPN
jgi:hypothetical protein